MTKAVRETEQELIAKAQDAISDCNWVVGECAAKWTKKYARGRTDADFAALVGLSGDQVFQRRRVWETFSDVYGKYARLRWSHFYVAVNWDNAPECLQWADENEATVAEMKAWRRLQLGEDLTEAPQEAEGELVSYVPMDLTEVREPGAEGREGQGQAAESRQAEPVVAGASREAPGSEDYAPFRTGAAAVPQPKTAVAGRPEPTTEQIVKRMTASLKRCLRTLEGDFHQEFRTLPEDLRESFLSTVAELHEKTQELR